MWPFLSKQGWEGRLYCPQAHQLLQQLPVNTRAHRKALPVPPDLLLSILFMSVVSSLGRDFSPITSSLRMSRDTRVWSATMRQEKLLLKLQHQPSWAGPPEKHIKLLLKTSVALPCPIFFIYVWSRSKPYSSIHNPCPQTPDILLRSNMWFVHQPYSCWRWDDRTSLAGEKVHWHPKGTQHKKK